MLSRQSKFIIAISILLSAVFLALIFLGQNSGVAARELAENKTETQILNSGTTTIQFFGDVMLDRNVAKNMGRRGLDYVFENFDTSSLNRADILAANLEGPFAPGRIKTGKSIAFRFDPKFAYQLKKFGFDAFGLANNHSYDMGSRNVKFTRQTLEKAGLGYFGDELNEGPEYTYITNTIAVIGLHNTYHQLDLKKVKAALDDARQKAKYVIVNVHWGQEYRRLSNKKQQTLAHWLVDNGADAIIGHHPHVVEEMEIYKEKPIFYSLGNFIFDQYFSKETQEGLSVILTLQNKKVKEIELVPFYSVRSQINLMSGDRRDEFLKWMDVNSKLAGYSLVNNKIDL